MQSQCLEEQEANPVFCTTDHGIEDGLAPSNWADETYTAMFDAECDPEFHSNFQVYLHSDL